MKLRGSRGKPHVALVPDVDRWSASFIVWIGSLENPGSNWIG